MLSTLQPGGGTFKNEELLLVEALLRDLPKRSPLTAAAVGQLAGPLLELKLKDPKYKTNTVAVCTNEILRLFVQSNASLMVQPLETFVRTKLFLHRAKTFDTIRQLSELNPVLAKAIIPAIEKTILEIQGKSVVGLETLKAQLKEFKMKYG